MSLTNLKENVSNDAAELVDRKNRARGRGGGPRLIKIRNSSSKENSWTKQKKKQTGNRIRRQTKEKKRL
ncbi:MAG: hypothetical protein LBO05_07065 [Deltaproteobacteria bacterium]|nr:hypothetical protein [Deltaproteobacteria bacterium]